MTAVRRVLVVTLRSIGDVVLSTPVIRAIRQHLPTAHLAVLVLSGSADLLTHHPDLDERLIAVNEALTTGPLTARAATHGRLIQRLRAGRFDLLIDLTDSDRTAVLSGLSGARRRVGLNTGGCLRGLWYHTVVRPERPRQHFVESCLQTLEGLAVPVQSRELVLPIESADETAAAELVAAAGVSHGGAYVVLHLGGWWRCPAWSLEQYGQLADRIQQELARDIVMVGTEADRPALEKVRTAMKTRVFSLAGRTTLPQLAALIRRARAFIGGNSGPMHIAAAVKTPVIALFGPEREAGIMTPWGHGHTVFYPGMSGKTVHTDEVYAAVRSVLTAPAAGRPA